MIRRDRNTAPVTARAPLDRLNQSNTYLALRQLREGVEAYKNADERKSVDAAQVLLGLIAKEKNDGASKTEHLVPVSSLHIIIEHNKQPDMEVLSYYVEQIRRNEDAVHGNAIDVSRDRLLFRRSILESEVDECGPDRHSLTMINIAAVIGMPVKLEYIVPKGCAPREAQIFQYISETL